MLESYGPLITPYDTRNWTSIPIWFPKGDGTRFNTIRSARGCPNFTAFMQIRRTPGTPFLNPVASSSSAPSVPQPCPIFPRKKKGELMRLSRSGSLAPAPVAERNNSRNINKFHPDHYLSSVKSLLAIRTSLPEIYGLLVVNVARESYSCRIRTSMTGRGD